MLFNQSFFLAECEHNNEHIGEIIAIHGAPLIEAVGWRRQRVMTTRVEIIDAETKDTGQCFVFRVEDTFMTLT